jgi:hypothetical protein
MEFKKLKELEASEIWIDYLRVRMRVRRVEYELVII